MSLFTAINLLVTWIFDADVDAQGGAYATGVLVLMSSACVATVIDHWRERQGNWYRRCPWGYVADHRRSSSTPPAPTWSSGPTASRSPVGSSLPSSVSSFWLAVRRSTELRFKSFEFVESRIEVPVGQPQAFRVSGAGAASAGPPRSDREGSQHSPPAPLGPTTCRSCSSRPNWAIPASSSTAR